MARSADAVVELLRARAMPTELATIRARLADGEEAIGMRMRDLFDVAKSCTDLPLDEVDRLLDQPSYEARMAAMCILDFKARRRLDDGERRVLFELYLARHDRITTWDMVDRAAPRVVGCYLAGRSQEPLAALARSDDPLRRRTAITAPLWYARYGTAADIADGFVLAAGLAADPEPTVNRAVGIYLKHAGAREPEGLVRFLDQHASTMARPALRDAVAKLDPATRERALADHPAEQVRHRDGQKV